MFNLKYENLAKIAKANVFIFALCLIMCATTSGFQEHLKVIENFVFVLIFGPLALLLPLKTANNQNQKIYLFFATLFLLIICFNALFILMLLIK